MLMYIQNSDLQGNPNPNPNPNHNHNTNPNPNPIRTWKESVLKELVLIGNDFGEQDAGDILGNPNPDPYPNPNPDPYPNANPCQIIGLDLLH